MKSIFILTLSLLAQGSLRFTTPQGWQSNPPASSMRLAEFKLPHVQGDLEDAEAAIFFFSGGGGSVEANFRRWTSQMAQPDGRPSGEVAKVTEMTVGKLQTKVLDLTGRYIPDAQPGVRGRNGKPGFRMIAAVVQTPAGPYFLKITGPEKTMERWSSSVTTFLKTMRFE